MEGQGGEDGLDSPRRPQGMASHGLGRAHHQMVGVVPKHRLDSGGLTRVIEMGRGAVGIDIVYLFRGYPSIARASAMAPGPARAVGPGGSHVIGVTGGSIAQYFSVDP